MREYNDYHNKPIQNKQSLLSPENRILIGPDKPSSPTLDINVLPSSKNRARNNSFSQNSGGSRLELTSREVVQHNIFQVIISFWA